MLTKLIKLEWGLTLSICAHFQFVYIMRSATLIPPEYTWGVKLIGSKYGNRTLLWICGLCQCSCKIDQWTVDGSNYLHISESEKQLKCLAEIKPEIGYISAVHACTFALVMVSHCTPETKVRDCGLRHLTHY